MEFTVLLFTDHATSGTPPPEAVIPDNPVFLHKSLKTLMKLLVLKPLYCNEEEGERLLHILDEKIHLGYHKDSPEGNVVEDQTK